MKLLLSLTTIALMSVQAQAGTILPDLSRSKADANSSPIAVGFSERKSLNLGVSGVSGSAETNGSDTYDQSGVGLNASAFVSTTSLHMEFVGAYTNVDTDLTGTNNDLSSNLYVSQATLAMPFADVFSAGVTLGYTRSSSLLGTTKDVSGIVEITPAIGMKFQPNMALGLGVRHQENKFKTSVVGKTQTELPALSTNEIFFGAAYGVDQKIGENGFGAEAIITYTPKSREASGATSIEQGSTKGILINGNYTLDQLDLGADLIFVTGDNYADTQTKSIVAVSVKPEYMIAEPLYIAPSVTFSHEKNSTSTGTDDNLKEKNWLFGLGVGKRIAQYDLEVYYNHGILDISPGDIDANTNVFGTRFSLYF